MVDPGGVDQARLRHVVLGPHVACEQLPFRRQLLGGIHHRSWLIIWARKENWIFKAKRALLCNEAVEVFVAQVSFLVFVLLEGLDAGFLGRDFASGAQGLETLDGLGGVAGDFEAVAQGLLAFEGRDVEVAEHVALDRFERLSGAALVTAVFGRLVGADVVRFPRRSLLLGRRLFLGAALLEKLFCLNVFKVLKKLFVFNGVQNILLVLHGQRIKALGHLKRRNWVFLLVLRDALGRSLLLLMMVVDLLLEGLPVLRGHHHEVLGLLLEGQLLWPAQGRFELLVLKRGPGGGWKITHRIRVHLAFGT